MGCRLVVLRGFTVISAVKDATVLWSGVPAAAQSCCDPGLTLNIIFALSFSLEPIGSEGLPSFLGLDLPTVCVMPPLGFIFQMGTKRTAQRTCLLC